MSFIIVVGVIAVILFLVPFLTRRRFGVLGLALAAGSLLSTLWSQVVTQFVSEAGVKLVAPPLEAVVAIVIVVLPAFLVVRSAQVYHSPLFRIIGSAVFALLGISLMLRSLEASLVIEGSGQDVFATLTQYHSLIITIGLLFAIIDVFLTKAPKAYKTSGKH